MISKEIQQQAVTCELFEESMQYSKGIMQQENILEAYQLPDQWGKL